MAGVREFTRWTLILIVCSFSLLACSLGSIPFFSGATPTPSLTPTPVPTNTPVPTPTPPALTLMQLNLMLGDVYRVRMVSDQVITQTLEGQTEESLQSFGYEFTYTVREVDAQGNTAIDVAYEWVFIEQGGSMGSVSYDSANPPEVIPEGALGFAALVGRGFSMRLTAEGEVLEISGLDAMYAEMLDELAPDDPEMRQVLEQVLQEQFGEEALSSQLNNIVFELPDEPIEVGESWTSSTQAMALVQMNLENVYTLRSFDGKVAIIDGYSTVTPGEGDQMIDMGFIQLSYALEGVQEGTTELDVTTGWTTKATITQNLSGVMTITAEGESLEVPITLESTSTVETSKE